MNLTTSWQPELTSSSDNDVTLRDVTDLSPAPLVRPSSAMIGVLSVQTVSFILLGVGAAAPVVLIATVAVVMRLLRTRRQGHYCKYVLDYEHRTRQAWYDDHETYGSDTAVRWYGGGTGTRAENGTLRDSRESCSKSEFGSNVSRDTLGTGSRTVSSRSRVNLDLESQRNQTFFQLTSGSSEPVPSVHRPSETIDNHGVTNPEILSAGSGQPLEHFDDSFSNSPAPGEFDNPIYLQQVELPVLDVMALMERGTRNDAYDVIKEYNPRPVSTATTSSSSSSTSSSTSKSLENSSSPKANSTNGRIPESNDCPSESSSSSSRLCFETCVMVFQMEEAPAEENCLESDLKRSHTDSSLNRTLQNPESDYSSTSCRQVAAESDPDLGAEEEQVLRCLDEVLLEYTDFSDEALRSDTENRAVVMTTASL